ncbi:protein AKNAD1 [Artibeus jamaicensis]|uniref:protein AKNAD1 n=1 Tax=Artibeus jamaicensis TaxID=9417 RepID=UPI00235A6D1F|nr:protein AKNAD1 [Artibeus jamaicensis]
MKTWSTVTVKDSKGRHDARRSGCTHMDEADLAEDGTCKRQEGLPYGGLPPQTKLWDDHRPSSKNHILGVSDQVSSAAGDPQEGATWCRNADTVLTMDKMNENTVEKKYDEEQQYTTDPPGPARGDLPKSNISDILQHHLSREEFLKGEGIDCETLPEISNPDSSVEAIVKSIIVRYVKSSWPEEQAPELTGQLDPERDEESGTKPSRSPTAAEESTSELEEPVAAGDGSHPESSNFLTEAKSPSHKQKGRQGQTPQNHQTEKTGSGHRFRCDQVHYRFSDFSNIAPTGKIPENNIIDKPLPTDTQDHFSHELRDRLALVQDILESLSRSNWVEKEEQERKTPDPSLETETEPTRHIYRERLTGTESETSLFQLTSPSQKNPPASSSYIFQKLSHQKRMCQKLREQTDRLRSKVQEFSKSIAQDSPRHTRDKRLALEKLQGHLAWLEQEFVVNKDKHLTWKQQVCKHEPPTGGDFDPERKVEGEMCRSEMLLEEVKEKIEQGKQTSASSPPVSPPATPAALPPPSSPPSDEWDPHSPSRRQTRVERAEITGWSCVFCHRVLAWEQNMEKKGHRRTSCHRRFLTALQEQALLSDSSLSPDTELSCYSASGTGPRSNKCETCGTKIPNSRRGCRKGPLREFHYKYNRPGQNYSNHEGGSAFVQLRFLNENKNSSSCGWTVQLAVSDSTEVTEQVPFLSCWSLGLQLMEPVIPTACSKPNWIYSEHRNSKPSQDEHEPIPGKNNLTAFRAYSSDLASSSPHFHYCRSSGSKSSGNLSSIEETKSEGLNSSLDNALRTAIVLKETTDRMIRTIAEDLAKVQRWRNRLKY